MRTEQRSDGTIVKVFSPTEKDLYEKMAAEAAARAGKDSELESSINSLNSDVTGLKTRTSDLEVALGEEETARAAGDNILQEQIDAITQQAQDSYTKNETKFLLIPWKVEEIDVPYAAPDNSYFNQAAMTSIRTSYAHFKDCVIDIPQSAQFGQNTMRRYTLLAFMTESIDVNLAITYDNQVAVYLNDNHKVSLAENAYAAGPSTVTLTTVIGWNKIQILIAQDSGVCGLKVEHSLTTLAAALSSSQALAGLVKASMIGPGEISKNHLNKTDEFEMGALTASKATATPGGGVVPAIKAGNGFKGAMQIGNVIFEKADEAGSIVVMHGSLHVTGALQSGEAASVSEDRTTVFINPSAGLYVSEVGQVVDDSRCWFGKGYQVTTGAANTGLKILTGFDEILHYGNYALTLRMQVAEKVNGAVITVRIHTASGVTEKNISGVEFANANELALVGVSFTYDGPAAGKSGLAIEIIYPNATNILIDWALLGTVTPISIDLPQHSHDDLYMGTQEIIDALALKADTGHGHNAGGITDTATKVIMTITERNKLANIQDNANNYTHPVSHPATMITEDVDHQFVTNNQKTTWTNGDLAVVTELPATGRRGQRIMLETAGEDEMHVCTKLAGDVSVAAEAVGSGDGNTVTFGLDYTNVKAGTLTVYLNGVATADLTSDLAAGTITFNVAPGAGVAITADYTYTAGAVWRKVTLV